MPSSPPGPEGEAGRKPTSASSRPQPLNRKVRDDARVDAYLLTVGDGVVLACKPPTP
jgi:hypothetical protein